MNDPILENLPALKHFILICALFLLVLISLSSVKIYASQAQTFFTVTSEHQTKSIKRSFKLIEQTLSVENPSSSSRVDYALVLANKRDDVLNVIGGSNFLSVQVIGESCDRPLRVQLKVSNENGRSQIIRFKNSLSALKPWNISIAYMGKKEDRKHHYQVAVGDESIEIPLEYRPSSLQQRSYGAVIAVASQVIQ